MSGQAETLLQRGSKRRADRRDEGALPAAVRAAVPVAGANQARWAGTGFALARAAAALADGTFCYTFFKATATVG
jgi:hypothetical protein